MNDGMVAKSAQVSVRAIGMTPVGSESECPPLSPVVTRAELGRLYEYERAGAQHVMRCSGIVTRIGRLLRRGDVARGFDESREAFVCDWRCIHEETVNMGSMGRCLFGVVAIGSHEECACGDWNHRNLVYRGETCVVAFHNHVSCVSVSDDLAGAGSAAVVILYHRTLEHHGEWNSTRRHGDPS